jgi:hypothetical protein
MKKKEKPNSAFDILPDGTVGPECVAAENYDRFLTAPRHGQPFGLVQVKQ